MKKSNTWRNFSPRKTLVAVAISSIIGSMSGTALAADVGGEITGDVRSSSGEVIGNATVTVRHNTKGITRTVTTNSDGEYVLRNLPVGSYTITISGDGYETEESTQSVIIGKPLVIVNTLRVEGAVEEIVVVGTQVQKINMAETTGGMSFDDAEMDIMPVSTGFEPMVLMTPGTVDNAAGSDFKGANAIGGGSPAENGYYLNGINITQIQQGLGSFRLPWEAIEQTNVQTGGLNAEFGSALGGIVNAVSKSGTNEFEFGIEARFDPEQWQDHPSSVRLPSRAPDVRYMINNQKDENSFTSYSVWASGPILEDRIFFYALFNPNKEEWSGAGNSTAWDVERDSDRWFVNLEWFITDGHSLGITAFNTERDRVDRNYGYDPDGDIHLAYTGNSFSKDGGDFVGINYHGEFTDVFSLDIVAGRTQEEEIPQPASDHPLVEDCRIGNDNSCTDYSNHSDASIEPQEFTRDQIRFDFHIDLDDHQISFGYDSYDIDVFVNTTQNGVIMGDRDAVDDNASFGWWQVGIGGVGALGAEAMDHGVADGQQYVRRRVRNRFSDSEVTSDALYIQDTWDVTDDLTLNFGFRYIDFANTVSSGEKYADMDGNIAPRLSAVYALNDTSKVFVSLGRYFQPVAARMNITQGSSSVEYLDYYATNDADDGLPALRADGSPERGARISRFYRQLGITDPNLIASKNLKAMYSDQISFGYNTELFDSYTAGARFTYNKLGRSVEDTDYGPVLVAKLEELGINDALGQGSFYVLANPGNDVQLSFDFDQDGTADDVTLSTDELQLPEAERQYIAWEFSLAGDVSDRFTFNASYTWSHSWGNTEGLVKTTNEQADPGWTSDYDYGDALDHAYGNLPNDRRHSIKAHGRYELTDYLTLGFVYRAQSGAPLNKLRPHPDGVDSCAAGSPWEACVSKWYIGGFYDENGNPNPRGSEGHLPWTHNLDLSLTYQDDDLLEGFSAKASIFNVFDNDKPVKVNEWIDEPLDYKVTTRYQSQRFISLQLRYEF